MGLDLKDAQKKETQSPHFHFKLSSSTKITLTKIKLQALTNSHQISSFTRVNLSENWSNLMLLTENTNLLLHLSMYIINNIALKSCNMFRIKTRKESRGYHGWGQRFNLQLHQAIDFWFHSLQIPSTHRISSWLANKMLRHHFWFPFTQDSIHLWDLSMLRPLLIMTLWDKPSKEKTF